MALISAGVVLRGIKQAQAIEGNAYFLQQSQHADATGNTLADLFSIHSESAVIANGLFLARQASQMEDSLERAALLDRVTAMVEPMCGRKAFWAEASTTLAYAYSLKDMRDPRFVQLLARSYEEAPYLRTSAYWRLHAGLAAWDRLDPATQRRVVNEAVWFTRVNHRSLGVVLPKFREQPSAYDKFMLTWLKARIGDRDFSPIKGLAEHEPDQ